MDCDGDFHCVLYMHLQGLYLQGIVNGAKSDMEENEAGFRFHTGLSALSRLKEGLYFHWGILQKYRISTGEEIGLLQHVVFSLLKGLGINL